MKNLCRFLVFVLISFIKISPTIAQFACYEETTVYNSNDVYTALPNIFTPNNDGINDLLTIYHSAATMHLIRITDTTANNNILFESRTVGDIIFWDGLDLTGAEAPEAAYNLIADFQYETGEIKDNCRTIYLVRENCIDLSAIELNFPSDFDETTKTFLDLETTLPDCILNTNELYTVEARIQPTLVQTLINVNSTEPVNSFIIYNIAGKTILSGNTNNELIFDVKVDLLKTGTYYLILTHHKKYSVHQFHKN